MEDPLTLHALQPAHRCMFYDRPVWCPALPNALIKEFGKKWEVPDRTPASRGMYVFCVRISLPALCLLT